MSSEYKIVKSFLERNINKLNSGSSNGGIKSKPNFDLFPSDYIRFAEEELDNLEANGLNIREKINCVLHLKRALDCQLDIFFHIFSLKKIIDEKNLGIPKKLDFLKKVGIINSRVIDRFNSLRNKIEHHYKIPEINDIEVYFDLINALVSLIEMNIYPLLYIDELMKSDISKNISIKLSYLIESEYPLIKYKIVENGEEFGGEVSVVKNYIEFTNLFKVFLLLAKKDVFVKESYILNHL
ncbi:hypothetical protein [Aeribacillus composti]|uniref:hypothetical protein n=1 Tax=Aeribacillus composti TaxID=1868734 RepID=UPI003D233EF0